MPTAHTTEKPRKASKVQKGYYLPVPLVKEFEHLATDLDRPACDLVEQAMLSAIDGFRAKLPTSDSPA